MNEDEFDSFDEPVGEPLPAWLLEPLTSGTFSNGMSKIGYLPFEAWAIEHAVRDSYSAGAVHE